MQWGGPMWASAPTKALQGVQWLLGGTMWASSPTEVKRKCIRYRAGGVEPRPYGGQQGVRKKNPPVTAAPCQPPLGKGAEGTGEADCHSQCAHWLRNDRELYMGCGTESAGGQRRPPLQMTGKFVQARERADVVGSGPYGCATRGAGKMADL